MSEGAGCSKPTPSDPHTPTKRQEPTMTLPATTTDQEAGA